jgi:hypothetical protein
MVLLRCLVLVLPFFLTACGVKSDGTPYGVNPNKMPDGKLKTAADSIANAHSFKGNMIPKAGEMNAVTNGARVGQPMLPQPAQ